MRKSNCACRSAAVAVVRGSLSKFTRAVCVSPPTVRRTVYVPAGVPGHLHFGGAQVVGDAVAVEVESRRGDGFRAGAGRAQASAR